MLFERPYCRSMVKVLHQWCTYDEVRSQARFNGTAHSDSTTVRNKQTWSHFSVGAAELSPVSTHAWRRVGLRAVGLLRSYRTIISGRRPNLRNIPKHGGVIQYFLPQVAPPNCHARWALHLESAVSNFSPD